MNKYPLTVAEKHKILYGNSTEPEVLVELGNRYLSDGDPATALEFFDYAGYSEGIKQIRKIAIDEGDLFLYKLTLKVEGINTQREDLIAIKENAVKLGKSSYAESVEKEITGREEAKVD